MLRVLYITCMYMYCVGNGEHVNKAMDANG